MKSKLEEEAKAGTHKKFDKKERYQLPVGVGGSGRRPFESADPLGPASGGIKEKLAFKVGLEEA